ncbi:MXAN_6640 family putative metalloprotease [Bacteroidota bacterium]
MKNIISIILLLSIVASFSYAQNIDSLFNEYLKIKRIEESPKIPHIHEHKPGDKCAFGIATILEENIDQLSTDKQEQLKRLLDRPVLDTSITSLSGRFRIHYNESGESVPQFDVLEVADAFDKAYEYEVETLGYPAPPTDYGEGGDDLFDVYIKDMGRGLYGETRFSWSDPDNGNVSYTIIDDDFAEVPTVGLNGAKVTAAHEFHHAVQVGTYGFNSRDRFYYEMTSTSMEEFVYDEINDYYQYLPLYFQNTHRSFAWFDGYEVCIWNLYLQQKFFSEENDLFKGHNLVKRSWELIGEGKRALEALNLALFEFGTTFKYELNNFGLWCYFTERKSITDEYFDEASQYPSVRPFNTYKYEGPKKEYFLSAQPISNNYLFFDLSSSGYVDTLVSIISNADFLAALMNQPFQNIDFTYALLTNSESGAKKIVNEYYSKITSDGSGFLQESNIFNDIIVDGASIEREILDFAFPQPFSYQKDNFVFIPVVNNPLGYAILNIYTASMDLVYSERKEIFAVEKIVVKWNGLDNDNNKLPTGVYIYVTNSDDQIKKGKFVIYND